nr:hypothetical protein Iba_chr04aCG14810 [Ipomoea batatas]
MSTVLMLSPTLSMDLLQELRLKVVNKRLTSSLFELFKDLLQLKNANRELMSTLLKLFTELLHELLLTMRGESLSNLVVDSVKATDRSISDDNTAPIHFSSTAGGGADAAIADEQSIELQSTDPPSTLLLLCGVTVLCGPIVEDEQANPASILVLLYGDEHTAQRDSPVSEAAAAWLPHRRALIPYQNIHRHTTLGIPRLRHFSGEERWSEQQLFTDGNGYVKQRPGRSPAPPVFSVFRQAEDSSSTAAVSVHGARAITAATTPRSSGYGFATMVADVDHQRQ